MLRFEKHAVLVPLALLAGLVAVNPQASSPPKLILAPMIGGLDLCLFNDKTQIQAMPDSRFKAMCLDAGQGAGQIVTKTLENISPEKETSQMRLGYTLHVPLFRLLEVKGERFEVNEAYLKAVINTIRQVDYPVVVYLFSTHFETGSPVEAALARNAANLLQTQQGTLGKAKYYGIDIYPWNFTSTENPVSRIRELAITRFMQEMCHLAPADQSKVIGLTVLGELHHLFPSFQDGMGFAGDYLITDYSPASVSGFRKFLENRFGSIAALNAYLDARFAGFEQVPAPGKDIRKEALNNYFEHLDAFAHGVIPVSGWTQVKGGTMGQGPVLIYVDGELLGQTAARYSRQDVLAAHPEFGTADVGWRYELDFSRMTPGVHVVEVFVAPPEGPMLRLAKREFAVVARDQSPPKPSPQAVLPPWHEPDATLQFSVDSPSQAASFYYNPLAALWHQFRQQQIAGYLDHFAKVARQGCLPAGKVFSHQIVPFANPGWDQSKYATGRDLAVPHTMRLGASLYGETSYGASFGDWFSATGRSGYGVTEFHPLKPLAPLALSQVFQTHQRHGAEFLSFFVNAYGLRDDPTYQGNPFSLDLDNAHAGSDVLFRSIQTIMTKP